MSIRKNQHLTLDLIKPEHVLVSVFDKTGLEGLVKGILEVNPSAVFYSTGGTGKKIVEILGTNWPINYMSVEDFTGAPEMEGGLVKTLHPKVHAGLLAERGNPAHCDYLFETLAANGTPGVYFDIFVGNLYPFNAVTAKDDCTAEMARINIDIGGPAMTMASAKNWPSIAVLTNPADYQDFIKYLKQHNGTTLEMRFALAQMAMKLIGDYRSSIGDYFNKLNFERDVLPTLVIEGAE